MKKVVLILVALLFGFYSNAQGVQLGVKAGVNFATINGDDAVDPEPDGRTSLNIGAVAIIPISDTFSVQPEAFFSGQGATADIEGVEATWKLNYINIPVLANVRLADGFSLQAGPQLGINVGDDIEVEDVEVSAEIDKSIDFGAAFGAQYQLENGLLIQARYALGLIDLYDDEDLKNGVFSISLGYLFDLTGNSNE
ncbi:MAG: PorT family protein [Flavobacteriaceae bacterium]|nr:PorT family protein [Bacteroidia bacterium]NNK86781.1 PorT family protein [Flavobacteriaceae bacterium]